MTTFQFVEPNVFAEGAGLALVNPTLIRDFAEDHGENLLEVLSRSEQGDAACKAGAVVPIIGLSLGYYCVGVASSPNLAVLDDVRERRSGWVLRVDDGPALLCGLGYLSRWNEHDAHHRKVALPSGWYAVETRGGPVADGTWGLEFALHEHKEKPAFTADLSAAFDMYLD